MNSELKYIGRGVLYIVMIFVIIAVAYFAFYYEKHKPAVTEHLNITYEDLINRPDIAAGKALFIEKCAACHTLRKGHDFFFQKIADNDYDPVLLYAFIRNSERVIKSGNHYVDMFNAFNKVYMTAFPDLTDNEIEEIIDYIKVEKTFSRLPKH